EAVESVPTLTAQRSVPHPPQELKLVDGALHDRVPLLDWQDPDEQACDEPQLAQTPPPLPHAALVLPGWQFPFASRQPEQEVTQVPPLHTLPLAHVWQAAPPAPHALF